MKKLTAGLVLVTAFAAMVLAPIGTAVTPKKLAFTATYSGTAVAQVTDQTAALSVNGTGKGTTIGASKITGTGSGNTSIQPCVPFMGPGSMVASNGTKLTFTVVNGSQGCGDEQGEVFSLSGKANVTSGKGKLAKAKGTLKFSGVYDHNAGTFAVKFTGILTF